MKKTRKNYDKAFKEEALRLLSEGRKVSQLSAELGISASYLYRWKKEAEEYDSSIRFSGQGNERLTEDQRRIKELEKELADAKMEQEILKKAIGIFSKRDSKNTDL